MPRKTIIPVLSGVQMWYQEGTTISEVGARSIGCCHNLVRSTEDGGLEPQFLGLIDIGRVLLAAVVRDVERGVVEVEASTRRLRLVDLLDLVDCRANDGVEGS